MNIFQLTALAAQIEDHGNSLQHQIKMYTMMFNNANADIAQMHLTTIQGLAETLSALINETQQEQQK